MDCTGVRRRNLFRRTVLAFAVSAAILAQCIAVVAPALADTSGARSPGSGASVNGPGTIGWGTADNITADDLSYATAVLTPFATSEYLRGTDYGFTIPAGATIDGIEVSIMRQSSSNSGGNSVSDVDLRLLKAGAIVGFDRAAATDWPTSMAAATYGGAADKWGTTWTPAEVNASTFGVSLSVSNQSFSGNRTASVDYMQITVTYTFDLTAPTVTINQAAGQADPTGAVPINFAVVFSESVSGFNTGDVTITGTASGTKTATVSGSGTTYSVAVTGMTSSGTVIANITAGRAQDSAGNANTASTSTDNEVTYSPSTHTVTATAGAGGSIAPGTTAVNDGGSQTFVIAPSTGYVVADVLVDGASQGRINSYTFTGVTGDHTISASFDGDWKAPSSGTNSGVGDYGNAYSSNDVRATFNSSTDVATYYSFGLSVPAGTINGIRVGLEGQRDSLRTWDISLSYDGGSSWTATKGSGPFGAADSTMVVGGDLWGYSSWTPAILNSNSFRVRLEATSNSGGGDVILLDQIQVKVDYSGTPAGIAVTPTSGLITTEAPGTAQFTIILNSQPTANVVVAMSSNDTSEGTVSPASVAFTSANWSNPQTVTVTGIPDGIVDGNVLYSIITAPATSTDANYAGVDAADISVTNNDIDLPPPPDTTPPAAVTNLAAGSPTQTTVTLTWTAPGDDATAGTATAYDVRYAAAAINEANWADAIRATGEPTPRAAGSSETFVVTGLTPNTTYYFVVKTADEVPNGSSISNSPSAVTLAVLPPPDTTPPAAVINLAAGNPTQTAITLTWTAPGDEGTTGTATSYDIRYAVAAIVEGTWAAATQVTGEPAPTMAGSAETMFVTGLSPNTTYYFALKTSDEVPNRSIISNSPGVATLAIVSPPPPPPAVGGGGGGGGAPSAPGVTSLSPFINDVGVFNLAAAAASEDAKVQLAIARGVQARTKDGESLKSASIVPIASPPLPPTDTRIIGLAYELGPDGATFAPPILLTFAFDPAALPAGFSARDLAIATWDAAALRWVPLDGITVDTTRNTVSAMVSHFSQYAVLAHSRPATFTMSNLTLSPSQTEAGDTVTATVVVANSGDLAGSFPVTLRVNGTTKSTQHIDVPGNSRGTVTFAVIGDAPGTYLVELNGLSGQFTIASPLRPATFSVRSLTVSPLEVDPGQEASVTAVVSNTGDSSGTYTVVLMIDGNTKESLEVILAAHASHSVALTASDLTPGTHTVTVGTESGTLVVKPMVPAAVRLVNWYVVALLIFALTAVASAFGFRMNARRAEADPVSRTE